jgi:hypothetical protein
VEEELFPEADASMNVMSKDGSRVVEVGVEMKSSNAQGSWDKCEIGVRSYSLLNQHVALMVFLLMCAFTNVYQTVEQIFAGHWRVVFYPLGILVETESFEVIHRCEQEVLLARYNTDSVGSCHVVKTPPSRRNEKGDLMFYER